MSENNEKIRTLMHDLSNKLSVVSGYQLKLERLLKKDQSTLDEKLTCLNVSKEGLEQALEIFKQLKSNLDEK